MKALSWAVALVCLAPGLLAQEKPKPDGVTPEAAAAYQKLVADYDATVKANREAVNKITQTDEYKKARKDRDQAKLDEFRQKMPRIDPAPFIETAQAGAKEFAGTEGAVDFLSWLAFQGRDKEIVVAAVDTLMSAHLDSPRLATFIAGVSRLQRNLGADRCAEILALAAEKAHDKTVRAQAMFATYNMVSRDREATAEAKAAAEKGLVAAAALAEGTALADRISGPLFIKNRLQIGMVAPDIEGEDLDGVPFKLSDYRGKVVVLDFWGDW